MAGLPPTPVQFSCGALTDPKKTLGPTVKMPAFKMSDADLEDVIAYLKSIAKH